MELRRLIAGAVQSMFRLPTPPARKGAEGHTHHEDEYARERRRREWQCAMVAILALILLAVLNSFI